MAIAVLVVALAAATFASRVGEIAPGERDSGAVPDPGSDPCAALERPGGDRLAPAPLRLLCGAGIDPNRDAAEDLELLPAVGPSRARKIVESREADGPFERPEDLARIKGIGPKTVERLRPWLSFD